jgi:hypothetical protein
MAGGARLHSITKPQIAHFEHEHRCAEHEHDGGHKPVHHGILRRAIQGHPHLQHRGRGRFVHSTLTTSCPENDSFHPLSHFRFEIALVQSTILSAWRKKWQVTEIIYKAEPSYLTAKDQWLLPTPAIENVSIHEPREIDVS